MKNLIVAACILLVCSFVNGAEEKKKKAPAKPAVTELVGRLSGKTGAAAEDVICQIVVRKKGTSSNLSINLKGNADVKKKLLELMDKKVLVLVKGKQEETFFQVDSAEETDTDPNEKGPKVPARKQ